MEYSTMTFLLALAFFLYTCWLRQRDHYKWKKGSRIALNKIKGSSSPKGWTEETITAMEFQIMLMRGNPGVKALMLREMQRKREALNDNKIQTEASNKIDGGLSATEKGSK